MALAIAFGSEGSVSIAASEAISPQEDVRDQGDIAGNLGGGRLSGQTWWQA